MKKYKNMFCWYEKHPKINMALGLDFTSTPFCFIIVKLTPFWSSSSSSSTSSSDVIDFWVLKGKKWEFHLQFTWNIPSVKCYYKVVSQWVPKFFKISCCRAKIYQNKIPDHVYVKREVGANEDCATCCCRDASLIFPPLML